MAPSLPHRLYLRIWLAVVATIVLLSFIFARVWQLEVEHERAQRPGREIIVRDIHGEILGQAIARPLQMQGRGIEFEVVMRDGQTVFIQLPRPNLRRHNDLPPAPLIGGDEFHRSDDQPPPDLPPMHEGRGGPTTIPSWWLPPYNLLTLLVFLAAAVALGAYPVVRRLTKRLEALQQGVESWGEGDLSLRLPTGGKDEVALLAQRFNVAAARVQALLQAHKTLLANASHELRSPLARIRMSLELMRATGDSVSKDEIARNIHELDQLIDEILLASRLDASPDALGPVEPVELIGLLAEECARTQAEFDPPEGATSVTVQGSSRLLRRAVRNLLENAGRHGAGQVTLYLRLKGAVVTIQVQDQGPGVPAALRERIFEPFFRLPGASERDGGVGLGLALVRSIALRHRGQVRCTDGPSGGACFELQLPLAEASVHPV
jgi:two-component system OmpR family sensor kinase